MTADSALQAELSALPLANTGVQLGAVLEQLIIDRSGDRVSLRMVVGIPAARLYSQLEPAVAALLKSKGLELGQLAFDQRIAAAGGQKLQAVDGVKNIIAIASGKGGVGKSTTAANIALALRDLGASVGLLDGDVYGPSQQLMLGVPEGKKPQQHGTQQLLPVEACGIPTMSMGYLVTERTPMVWRGPMASGALEQMLYQTYWQNLDYLIVDMPPGTGDIQLTLSQKVPVAGAAIVTTPQDIALLDARKGIEMFNKVDVPVLGIIENMAVHVCTQCGHREHLFGEGGGDRIAKDYGVALLGALPLSLCIRECSDKGLPVVVAQPDSPEAVLYRDAALALAARLAERKSLANDFPEIVISDD